MAHDRMTAATLRHTYIEAVNIAVAQDRLDLVAELASEYADALIELEPAA